METYRVFYLQRNPRSGSRVELRRESYYSTEETDTPNFDRLLWGDCLKQAPISSNFSSNSSETIVNIHNTVLAKLNKIVCRIQILLMQLDQDILCKKGSNECMSIMQ
ncbi:hypothetical protein C0J52_22693 [Blattella germanica]|nr:hypothetical protein C0J52_22693 [Blattella germanica]